MNGLYDYLPAIIARIRAHVSGFAVVDALSVVQNENDILKNLPGCWVAPGKGYAFDDNVSFSRNLDQGYTVIVAVKAYQGDGILAETVLGEYALDVIKAFDRYALAGDGSLQLKLPIEDIVYDDGFILQRLRFSVSQTLY